MNPRSHAFTLLLGACLIIGLPGCGSDRTGGPADQNSGLFDPVDMAGPVSSDDNWSDAFADCAPNGYVYALFACGNDLIVGGQFTRIGQTPARLVARWTGTEWKSFPSDPGGVPRAFASYNGNLVAGGDFGGIESTVGNLLVWDGTAWSPLGDGLNDVVRALAVYDGDLIAGGLFSGSGTSTANHIARWNGSEWLPVGDGLPGTVLALLVHDDFLYAAGKFGIQRWDGSRWESLASGEVDALEIFRGELVAGGAFTSMGNHIAVWDGSAWNPLGPGFDKAVTSLAVYQGDLIAAGGFTWSGVEPVNRVARWNGSAWERLGSGVDKVVWALLPFRQGLYVGGAFLKAGGKLSRGIARWDQSRIDGSPGS